jgi:hypothetical protein
MRVEIDLAGFGDWFFRNAPLAMLGAGVVWYWVVGQAIRVAYWRRRHWFGKDFEAESNAFLTWALSPIFVVWLPVKAALWAFTMNAVKPPWREFP